MSTNAPRMISIRNLKTNKVYTVTGEGWEKMKECVVDKDNAGRVIQRLSDRFAIVDERVLIDTPGVTFEPDEIKEAVRNMAKGTVKVEHGDASKRVQ